MRGLILALLVITSPALASTVIELGPQALEAGADRIVEGRVIASETRWSAVHRRLETHATIAIEATRKGQPAATVEIVVPGGTLGDRTQIVLGMPAVIVGERARWYLKTLGDGTYRVYGWSQGKWVERGAAFVRDPIAAERDPRRFNLNAMVWPASEIPVRYLINDAGSDDLATDEVIAAFDAAFATWQAVPTASLAFQNDGTTTLGLDSNDDTNVMLFVETGWSFGSEAAAATSLQVLAGMQTADIAVNGENFTWAIGPASSAINSNVLDLQAVLAHEIGHFSGLDHSTRSIDTMYFSWKPWQSQRTLSVDDKLGLTSKYPVAGNECATAADCDVAEEETCETYAQGRLCTDTPDPIGTPCNYDRIECEDFCLFTVADLSAGYCSKACEDNSDCPLSHHCDQASAGGSTVKVCFEGAQPPPPPPACVDDAACPAGQFCDVAVNECTFECRTAADCGSGTCAPNGQCVADDDGGCCSGSGSGASWLLGLLVILLITSRRSS